MRIFLRQYLHSLHFIFLALLLLTLPVSSVHAADDTGQYKTMGLGNLSCKSFMSEDKAGAAYYLSWLAGYMTAYNLLQEDTYSVLGKTKTVDQLESWLRDYCTVNGEETFEYAVTKLLKNLKYFRIKRYP